MCQIRISLCSAGSLSRFLFFFLHVFVTVFFPQILMSAHRVQAFFALSAAWMFLVVISVLVLSRDTPWQPMEEPVEVMRSLGTEAIMSWRVNPWNDLSHYGDSVKSSCFVSVTVKKPVFDKVAKYWYLLCQLFPVAAQLSMGANCLNEFLRDPTSSFRLGHLITCMSCVCTLAQQ